MPLPYNRRAVAVFLGAVGLSLTLLCAGLIGYDWSLFSGPGGGGATISWGMAVLGHDQPIVAFLWGLAVASVFWIGVGLAVHFWWGTTDPDMYAELVDLQAEVERLKAEAAGKAPTEMA